MDKFKSKLSFLKNKKIIIGILILAIIIGLIVYFSMSKDKNEMKNVLYIEELSYNNPLAIPNCEISRPKNGSNFTCNFWIKINKFYDNHRYWRHIFHKGTDVRLDNLLEYQNWDDISKDLPEQYPGLWMNPINDNLRLCFTTEITNDYESKKHPNHNSMPVVYDDNPDNALDIGVEYFDIIDIPINKEFNLGWILNNQVVDVFLNNELIHTFSLKGRVLVNNGAFYFNYPKTINADMKQFNLIPKILEKKSFEELYQKKPKF